MRSARATSLFRVLLAAVLFLPAVPARALDHPVTILEGRTVSVTVPNEWKFEELRDPKSKIQTLRWLAPAGEIQLDASFFADAGGRVATPEGLKAEMEKIHAYYRSGAVEKEGKPVDLEPSGGIGAYMTFTDSRLVGKKLPPGERLFATTGIRSWKGAYLVFTLLSNSRDAAAWRQALEIVRSGMKETFK